MQSSKDRAMMAQIKKNIKANKKLTGTLKISYTIHGHGNEEPTRIVQHGARLEDVAKLQNQFKGLKQQLLLKVENDDEKHKGKMVFDQ